MLVRLVADDQRVAGVVAALVPGDHVRPLGQEVDDLALALVPPLGADDHRQRHQVRPKLSNLV
jgi:orotidine-5'-phosphate decarboxylase